MLKSIPISGVSREDWLQLRRASLGGSDAAAVLGMSGYSSPFTVWADKTGRLPDQPDNEAMRQGRDLEDYVARRFYEETSKRVRRMNAILYDSDRPYMHANIDRAIVGERAGLECKTTSALSLKRFKNGEFPDQYYTQCVHYLAVTGWDRWYLGVLVLGRDFLTFTIERDEEEIQALIGSERLFWEEFVEADRMPEPDGHPATSQALTAVFPPDAVLDTEIRTIQNRQIIQSYKMIRDQITALEREKERCEQILKEELGQATEGDAGAYRILWKPQQRKTFDHGKLLKHHPELDDIAYWKTSSFRKFEIREVK